MEVSEILGDHSYVCARHFRPEDIIVHPHVCRLNANAVPSVFRNYPINLPRQFFKKICQTAAAVHEEVVNSNEVCETVLSDSADTNSLDDSTEQLVSILSPPSKLVSEDEEIVVSDSHSQAESEDERPSSSAAAKFPRIANPSITKAKLRQRLHTLELRHRQMGIKLEALQSKLDLYNIGTLEKDAANQNEEAKFLLDMLRTYTEFEKTRKEILSNPNES